MIKVSVIVPVYNTPEKYLRNSIESLLNQTMTDFEIVMIDDGSEKWCGDILDEYKERDSRVVVCHKTNAGVSMARNVGLEYARGEWITFVDSDDWIEKDMLEVLLEVAYQQDADTVMWRFDKDFEFRREETPFVGQPLMVFEGEDTIKLQQMMLNFYRYAETMQFTFLPTVCCKMYKASILKENKIDFPLNVKNGEDAIFALKIFNKTQKVVFIDRILYHYVQRSESVTKSFNIKTVDSWIENRRAVKLYLEENNMFEKLQDEYDYHAIEVLKLLMFTVYAHPDKDNEEKILPLRELLNIDVFKDSIKRIPLSHVYGMKGKVVTICARYRMVGILVGLTRFRWKMIADKVV